MISQILPSLLSTHFVTSAVECASRGGGVAGEQLKGAHFDPISSELFITGHVPEIVWAVVLGVGAGSDHTAGSQQFRLCSHPATALTGA